MHIDVLPAMTGVTRFGELGAPWTYSKVQDSSHSCDAFSIPWGQEESDFESDLEQEELLVFLSLNISLAGEWIPQKQ